MNRLSPRFLFALAMGKLASFTQRLLGMNASFFPGSLAIRLCPDFLAHLGKPRRIIAVTGTNGKTTVCNMIIDVLTDQGYDVLHNRAGSNVDAGVATALLSAATWSGRATKDLAVFEVDERSSVKIFAYLTPDWLVCTNLFRDSIRRNAHPEFISGVISAAVPKTTTLVLNADDLISSRLAPGNPRVTFSLDRLPTDTDEGVNIINDMRVCPQCHSTLAYHWVRYHHIGKAYCPQCGFASLPAVYTGRVDYASHTLEVSAEGASHRYGLIQDSTFNIYNQLTVITMLREFGLASEAIAASLAKIRVIESRHSHQTKNGFTLITNLAKGQNPIACSCVFTYVNQEPGRKTVMLMLDDMEERKETSEMIPWIYDADFEQLNDDSIVRIIISSRSAPDYKLRLLMAGVPEERIFCTDTEVQMPDALDLSLCDTVVVLHDINSLHLVKQIKQRVWAMVPSRVERAAA